MKRIYHIADLVELPAIAAQIWRDFGDETVFLLYGDLGAGKTTLVQAFGKILGVVDDIVSPTYTIINEYRTGKEDFVYHADLYRIKSTDEAYQTGIEDYLFSDKPCFIEWPDVIESILPPNFVKLDIVNTVSNPSSNVKSPSGNQTNGRTITVELHA